jgi:hypothetical protein
LCIYRYNGLEGTHIKVTEFVRDKDCLVCGPGTLIEMDTSSTLAEVRIANPSQQRKILIVGAIFVSQDCLTKIPAYLVPRHLCMLVCFRLIHILLVHVMDEVVKRAYI